jgi:DNA-binding sugar fermentation-stimulating protein
MNGLRHLAFRGNDVIVFQILDPAEIRFDFPDAAQFVDMETRAEMHVIPDYIRQEYRRVLQKQIAEYEKECRKDRMDFYLIDTSQPLDSALFGYLVRREQLY